jgi:hypothetical protein
MASFKRKSLTYLLTLILLTSTKLWALARASKWQTGFNSAFKVLNAIFSMNMQDSQNKIERECKD